MDLNNLKDQAMHIMDAGKAAAGDALNSAKEEISKLKGGNAGEVINKIKDGEVLDKLKDKAGDVLNGIADKASGLADKLGK